MSWNDGLVGPALKIATSSSRSLRVMAGPGTGKSHAMKRRIARLLEEGADPTRILAVTFTRNAAKELIKDLRSIGVAGCDKVPVGTLHAFCLSILHKRDILAALGRGSRLMMDYEVRSLAHDLSVAGFGKPGECTDKLLAYEAAWARLQDEQPGWPVDDEDRRFQAWMSEWMKFHGALLVGEVIPLTLQYLRGNPQCEEMSAFDHVIVDEYQDLNRAEQVLIDLVSSKANLAVVGDEDQSIYSFRHAHPAGIQEFSSKRVDANDEGLSECRRCPKLIVSLANDLIKNNHPSLPGPRLVACDNNPEGDVKIVQWKSFDEEVVGITELVRLQVESGKNPGDFMLLCSRIIGAAVKQRLQDYGISAHNYYAENALESAEAQKAFTTLALLVNPEDRVSFRFLVGVGSSTWLAKQYTKLRTHCEQAGGSLRQICQEIATGKQNIRGLSRLVGKSRSIEDSVTGVSALAGHELVEALFPEAQEWTKPIREILERFVHAETSAQEIYEELVTVFTQPEMPEHGDFVRIMSLYKSKGLSSKIVIVSSCVQGVIPRLPKPGLTHEAQREFLSEQRRLFYVAMTRAREQLVLSSSQEWPKANAMKLQVKLQKDGWGFATNVAQTSQFLSELGASTPISFTGEDFLADLRARGGKDSNPTA